MPGTEAGVQQAADEPLFLAAADATQLRSSRLVASITP